MKLKSVIALGLMACLTLTAACGGESDDPVTPNTGGNSNNGGSTDNNGGGSNNGGSSDNNEGSSDNNGGTVSSADFVKGADISWVTEMEAAGKKFYDVNGTLTDCFELMKQYDMNVIRLRVWVNPTGTDVYCNKEYTIQKAERAVKAGMDVMIDFHYSDSWADPQKQNIPSVWASHDYTTLKEDVATHTKDVLQGLKDKGITPKWVQVGNEISNGFLWTVGQADKNPKQYAGLFAAGYDAVKSVFPEAIVLVHLDNGWDNSLYVWNLNILKNNGAKWDMIGMSLYPYWSKDKVTTDECITKCISNIKAVNATYGSPVMIVETGVQCGDGNGGVASASALATQRDILAKIIKQSRDNTNGICKGVIYWEPECRPADNYVLGAFDNQGKPTVIMDAFKE
jgi:arabinogalactan endo-1,4-beta-galactosidase